MTRTERAWELFLSGIQGTYAIKVSDAFKLAKAFEAEAAKHEAPKSGMYCIGWSRGVGHIQIEGEAEPRELAEATLKKCNRDLSDDESPFFLVEVRRVK